MAATIVTNLLYQLPEKGKKTKDITNIKTDKDLRHIEMKQKSP
jgi:hypothetical protein